MFYTGVMDRIPVRELNQQTSAVLARVQHGETLEVTVNGQAVAKLVPLEPSPLDNLIRQGRVIPVTDDNPFPLLHGEVDLSIDSTDVVSDLREERSRTTVLSLL
jgi:prevent-host-death family protein